MERFDEEFYSQLLCDPEEITVEKITASKRTKTQLCDVLVNFGKVYKNSKCLILSAATKMEELNTKLICHIFQNVIRKLSPTIRMDPFHFPK